MTTTDAVHDRPETGRWRTRLLAALLALPLVLAALAIGTAPQPAAASPVQAWEVNPYTPQQVCNNEAPGSGYYIQRTFDWGDVTTYQLYNGTYNCAVMIKNTYVGQVQYKDGWMHVCIEAKGGGRMCDDGNYRYYAGAVWTYGQGSCVRVNYAVGRSNVGDTATSSWANCG